MFSRYNFHGDYVLMVYVSLFHCSRVMTYLSKGTNYCLLFIYRDFCPRDGHLRLDSFDLHKA